MYREICSFTRGISFSLVKSAASRLYCSRSPCTVLNVCCTGQDPDCTVQNPLGLPDFSVVQVSIPIVQLGILTGQRSFPIGSGSVLEARGRRREKLSSLADHLKDFPRLDDGLVPVVGTLPEGEGVDEKGVEPHIE